MAKFIYNGKEYESAKELGRAMFEEISSDPNNTNLVWEYQTHMTIVNGKPITQEGSRGKCAYMGKVYEGVIEHKDNCLYVGGEFVKQM